MSDIICEQGIKTIADHYGLENQIIQLFEEMGELQQAVCKYRRSGYDSTSAAYTNAIEELADVSIMIRQMVYFLDCKDDVAEEEEYKIMRQLKIIDGTFDEVEDRLLKILKQESRRIRESCNSGKSK